MMIWTRFGILVPLIFVFSCMVGVSIAPNSFYVSFLIAAVILWFAGKKINHPDTVSTYINEKTNEKVTLDRRSTFFFIPMEYFAFVAVALGILCFIIYPG